MNLIEDKLVDVLTELREKYDVKEVKAEFEAEATRMEELMRLKEIVDKCGLGLIVKIGGAEAITDLYLAQHIGVTGIIAPMIESSFALGKYLSVIKTYVSEDVRRTIHFGVNLETIQAYANFDAMLNHPDISLLSTVTVGRVDLSGSMGLVRKDINSEAVFTITRDIFQKAKRKNMRTTMGGGISVEAIPFIRRLDGLLDRFETRKIVFQLGKDAHKIERGIHKAVEFELLWLKNKKEYYAKIASEDDVRIKMIESRLASGKK
jgi:hypothetical protein